VFNAFFNNISVIPWWSVILVDETGEVMIENDYIYIVGGVVVGFTSGYFSSLCMMYGPK
jgi:hypothetical protein